jgi:hypothetical protein
VPRLCRMWRLNICRTNKWLKRQENTASPEAECLKVETTETGTYISSTWKSSIAVQRKCNVSVMQHHYWMGGWNFNFTLEWCSNDTEEQVHFIVNVFTLQEVTMTLWGKVDEVPVFLYMSSTYTIYNVDAKTVVLKYQAVKRYKWL